MVATKREIEEIYGREIDAQEYFYAIGEYGAIAAKINTHEIAERYARMKGKPW